MTFFSRRTDEASHALDAAAVERHAAEIVDVAGGIDISLNAIGLGTPRARRSTR